MSRKKVGNLTKATTKCFSCLFFFGIHLFSRSFCRFFQLYTPVSVSGSQGKRSMNNLCSSWWLLCLPSCDTAHLWSPFQRVKRKSRVLRCREKDVTGLKKKRKNAEFFFKVFFCLMEKWPWFFFLQLYVLVHFWFSWMESCTTIKASKTKNLILSKASSKTYWPVIFLNVRKKLCV